MSHSQTQNRLLGTLRLAVEVYNTKMGSLHIIKTDDIAEWFTQNGTYKFLHRNNLTDKVSSVFVAAERQQSSPHPTLFSAVRTYKNYE